MTDIASNSGAQRLVVDTLNCNIPQGNQCLEYVVGYHIREGETAINTTDANLTYRFQQGNPPRYLPVFPSSSRNLQTLYFQGLNASTELGVAAVSLGTLRSGLRIIRGINTRQVPGFDPFLNFMYLGSFEHPDNIQNTNNQALFDSVFSFSPEDFSQVHQFTLPFLHYNGMSLGALMTQEVKVRMNLVRDWFALRTAFESSVDQLLINPQQKTRLKTIFQNMLRNIYFANPALENIGAELNQLAREVLANPAQGRNNLYAALSQIFSQALPYRRLGADDLSVDLSTNSTTATREYANLSNREAVDTYSTRFPFNVAGNNFLVRLQLIQRSLQNAPLRSLLEYSALSNPQQNMMDSKVVEYARRDNASMILRNVTSHSQIQVGRMNADWLMANQGSRIREILTALLFSQTPHNPQAPAILQARPGSLPSMLIRVDQLREGVSQLLLQHPTEVVEYRAAALGLMIQLFGNGVVRNNFTFQIPSTVSSQSPAELRLDLSVESRTELNAFYRELASSLGYSDAANSAQTSIQWVSLALCVAGTGTRVIYNSTQNNWDGGGDGLLAASGVFCGYSAGAFGADLFGGNRRNNRITRNNIAGGVGATLFGVLGGTLPMLAPQSVPPPNNMMMPPMVRPRDARNPTTGYGP